MASLSSVRATCRVLTAMILVGLSAGAIALPQTRAAGLEELNTSLNIVPADAAFYSTMLRNREQIEAIADSRAWAKILEMPVVQMGLAAYDAEAQNPQSVPGMIQAALENPETRELIHLAAGLFSDEVFVYGAPGFVDCAEFAAEISAAVQYGPMILQLSGGGEGMGESELQQMMFLSALAENADRIKIPELIIGMKVRDRDAVIQQLDGLEQMASAMTEQDPMLSGRFKRAQIGGHEYLTLSLDGSLVPWNEVPMDELEAVELSPGDAQKVVAALKRATLVIALGLRDDYLLLSIGSSTESLARLGSGDLLVDRAELKPIEKHADRRLTSIGYVSKALMAMASWGEDDLDGLLGLVDVALPAAELTDEQEARIRKDAAEVIDDLKGMIPEPGATMNYSFLADGGMEGFQYNWSEHPQWDGSKPLEILQHLGGNPLMAIVGRGKHSPEDYELLVKWAKTAYGYFEEFAVPQMSNRERGDYERFVDLFLPLVRRADQTNRQMLIPALADGQAAFVLDAKLQSRQWLAHVPPMQRSMPMLEPALVVGVSDAELLVEALREYAAIIDDAIDAVGQLDPGEIPEGFAIPSPEETNTASGTLYSFRLPEELGIDRQVVPNFGLSETMAVVSASHDHTQRLLRATPLEATGALADLARPRAAAAVLDFAALIDAATPWIDLAVVEIVKAEADADPAMAADITLQVHTALDVLKVLRKVTTESYFEDGALVTHNFVEVRDVE